MFGGLRKAIFNLSIVLLFVFTSLMVGMHYLMINQSRGWYLGNGHISFLFKFFCFFVIAFYTALAVLALLKFSVKRKLCTVTNLKIFIVSVLLFYPLSWQVNKLRKHKEAMEKLIANKHETCLNPDSPMRFF
jgi:hypothetical protein